MSVRTIDDLKDYMLLHGNITLGDFQYTKSLDDYIDSIKTIDIPFNNGTSFYYIWKSKMKNNAKLFLNGLYDIHPVGYLPDKKIIKVLNSRKINSISDIIDYYNSSINYIDPFDLPIKYKLNDIKYAALDTQALLVDNEEYKELVFKKINPSFAQIRLPKRTSEISTASYIHELTHSQLESYKGIIKEYYNGEVLSIFNELLYSYMTNKDLFYYEIIVRLNGLFSYYHSIKNYDQNNNNQDYSEFDYHSDIKYMTSILKAIQLLAIYTQANELSNKLISSINDVMNGSISIEELLDSYDIDMNNSLNPDNLVRLI